MKNILLLLVLSYLITSCGNNIEYPYTLGNAEVANIGEQIIYSGGVEIPTASAELLNYEGADDYTKDVIVSVEFIDEETLTLTLGEGPFSSFLNDSLMNLPYTLVDNKYSTRFELGGDAIEFGFTGDEEEIVVDLLSVVQKNKTQTPTSSSTVTGHSNFDYSQLQSLLDSNETIDTLVTRRYEIIIK